MSIIVLEEIGHEFGDSLLFENINISLDKNTRAGLVGRNGTGKSTLFKIITGEMQAKYGNINRAKNANISFLSQEFDFETEDTVFHWLLDARHDILELKEEIDRLHILLETDHSEKNLNRLADLQHEFEALDAYEYENSIKMMLTVFNFSPDYYQRSVNSLSGGEKTRLRLIHTLLEKHDIMLLDEPTNHLDIKMIEWLVNYLISVNCAFLIVSHDRYLLDKAVNKIYELREKRISTYGGNFSFYETEKTARHILLQKQYEQQQKLIEKTEDFIQRNMAGQKVNQAKSRLKMLDRMEIIEKPGDDKHLKLRIQTDKRSGNDIYRLEHIDLGYPDNLLARDICLNIHYQDKICLLGPNGSGKSTLIKMLLGNVKPLSGNLWTGSGLSIAYYDQLHYELDLDIRVIDTIWQLVPFETIGYVLGYLARFGFTGDKVEQRCESLSGGEKARLYLAKMIHEKPNLLILDEPTNHLDISMIKSLERALKEYDGTIIFVSHDRYFIQNVAKKIWIFKDMQVLETIDPLETLIDEVIVNNEIKKKQPEKEKLSANRPEKIKKINPYIIEKLYKEIQEIEKEIASKKQSVEMKHLLFSDPDNFGDSQKIKQINIDIDILSKEITQLQEILEEKEMTYLELLD
ncbi:MAG TPA: ABC-F family ATP-binding cassette domain-containing protein [Candidatus Cloacimonadota bacterium]|nr:ABC-F family ATP-binding cassette domain-containing protein [Candidatus Cloacimonadota bacterium]